jgi:hypothetical protein
VHDPESFAKGSTRQSPVGSWAPGRASRQASDCRIAPGRRWPHASIARPVARVEVPARAFPKSCSRERSRAARRTKDLELAPIDFVVRVWCVIREWPAVTFVPSFTRVKRLPMRPSLSRVKTVAIPFTALPFASYPVR